MASSRRTRSQGPNMILEEKSINANMVSQIRIKDTAKEPMGSGFWTRGRESDQMPGPGGSKARSLSAQRIRARQKIWENSLEEANELRQAIMYKNIVQVRKR